MSRITDIILFPFRCISPNNNRILFIPVTPLSNERFEAVLTQLEPGKKLLDIGCEDNRLVRRYRDIGGEGVGLDLTPNPLADIEVENSQRLPFPDKSFDYITLVATINHIPYRDQVLKDALRCLRPGGKVLLTNLTPLIGTLGHKIWHMIGNDPDVNRRGHMEKGEENGLSNKFVRKLILDCGFSDIRHTHFSFGLNNLFTASRPSL